ncbi:uncharacterized protein LOC114654916 isoform X2 [Erpetoichthys calabaricus]|uniref:uncharacterized protein LOC114654916 isoform X2 n=1 Tax=Erpetoichthys calabaricus TaxID=27687 RepID=UPI002234CC9E|nr:uncharacterized protein LOC114654916 isoform X2 [Erpetoichthys calabaricus]
MFKKATKKIAYELDPTGMLIPVQSSNISSKFKLLYLVKKVVSIWPWKPMAYVPTGVNLDKVLKEGDTRNIGQETNTKVTVSTSSIDEGKLRGTITTGIWETDGKATVSLLRSIGSTSLEAVEVSLDDLMKTLERSKFDMSHWLIKKLQMDKVDGVGIVIQEVRTTNPLEVQMLTSARGSLKFHAQPLAQVSTAFSVDYEHKLTVEEGTILAFRVYELNIQYDGTLNIHIPEDNVTDFKSLKSQMGKYFREFTLIDKTTKTHLWKFLSKLLPSTEALSLLFQMLEFNQPESENELLATEALNEDMKQTFKDLEEFLGISASDEDNPNELVRTLMIFVGVADDLDDLIMKYICRINKEARKQKLQLVETILEQVCSENETSTFTLPEGSFAEDEEFLTLCGIEKCEDMPTGNHFVVIPSQKPILLSMYVMIYGLESLDPENEG